MSETNSDAEHNVISFLRNMERRITNLEDSFVTLIIALKEGGIIADSDEEINDKQYHFDFREDND
jgi:hypothetical protein